MGDQRHKDAHTRRAFTGLLTAAAFAPAVARAQYAAHGDYTAPGMALQDMYQKAQAAQTMKAGHDEAQRMTVPVMVNGQGPFAFVVDTGSNRTVIADSLASRLDLPAGAILQVSSATGLDSTPSALISKLSVGQREVTNIQAPVLVESNLGADGMLGIDAIADQTIIMNFKTWTMAIQPSSRKNDDPDAVVVRGRSNYGQLILVDSSAEGVPLYVIIDTGGEMTIGNLMLQRTLARRRAREARTIRVESVTGGHADADQQLIQSVSIGHVDMKNLPIAYADLHAFERFGLKNKPAMLLGMSTLRLFERVWIDFKAREVRFLFNETAGAGGGRNLAEGLVRDGAG